MASKDFEKMIKMGELLERFLNPSIKFWELKQLFNDGALILNLEHKFPNLPSIDGLQFGDKQRIYEYRNSIRKDMIEWRSHKNNLHRVEYAIRKKHNKHNLGDWNYEPDYSPLEKTIIEKFKKNLENFESSVPHLNAKDKFIKFLWKFKQCHALFRRIQTIDLPWQEALYEGKKKDRFWANSIIKNYEFIVDSLKEKDGKFRLQKSFKEPLEGRVLNKTVTFNVLSQCYDIIISRISIDFLIMNGKDYFHFCNNCRRFTVVKRKGRKKFCSDICRTNYNLAISKDK